MHMFNADVVLFRNIFHQWLLVKPKDVEPLQWRADLYFPMAGISKLMGYMIVLQQSESKTDTICHT